MSQVARQSPSLRASVEHCAFAVHEIHALGDTDVGFGSSWPWYEVLIRPHREVHPGSPGTFIDRLYRERSSVETDAEVAERVVGWLKGRKQPTRASINTHPESLTRSKFIDKVIAWHRELTQKGHSICVELIEFGDCPERSTLVANALKLRKAGIPIALDDFGSRLNCFDLCAAGIVDVLKIDTSVINRFDKDANQRAVIESIKTLGRGLGAEVVAEGVERVEEMNALREMGIDFAQGFYFHKPEIVEI